MRNEVEISVETLIKKILLIIIIMVLTKENPSILKILIQTNVEGIKHK